MSVVLLTQEQAEAIAIRAVEIALSKITKPEITQPEQKIYLTSNQVRDNYKISLPTLWKYRNDGVIPYHRIGKKILFLENEIEASFKKFQLKKKREVIA